MSFSLGSKERLIITIAISFSFFVAEITGQRAKSRRNSPLHASKLTISIVAFKTKSLALLADAFHYVRSTDFRPTRDQILLTEHLR